MPQEARSPWKCCRCCLAFARTGGVLQAWSPAFLTYVRQHRPSYPGDPRLPVGIRGVGMAPVLAAGGMAQDRQRNFGRFPSTVGCYVLSGAVFFAEYAPEGVSPWYTPLPTMLRSSFPS